MLSDRSKQNNEGGKLQAVVIAVRERAHSECGVPASNQQPKKSNPTPGYLRHYGSGYRWNYRLSGELRAEMERGIATSPEVRKATGGSGKLMKAVSSKSTAIVVLQHTPYQLSIDRNCVRLDIWVLSDSRQVASMYVSNRIGSNLSLTVLFIQLCRTTRSPAE